MNTMPTSDIKVEIEEFLEGQADRIESDGATERVRLIGNAKLRLLRAGAACGIAWCENRR